jgi:ATP-binding cassette, subfamily B, bacterial
MKRMLAFAVPHAPVLTLFFIVMIMDSSIGICNPLVYRATINNGILKGNASLTVRLALVVALLAVFDAVLTVSQSYLSVRIGTRVVLSLRTELFRHIQKLPLAFFARTQTGSLVTRLNNDVTGAQSAFTDILSNIVGNVITGCLILCAIFALSWQIGLAALTLLPIFILSARLWGRKLQTITQEHCNLTALMTSTVVERFSVGGAQLTKLYGRPEEEIKSFEITARRVADILVKKTSYGSIFYAALLLVAAFTTALAYGWGGLLAIHHALDVGAVVALGSYLARLYIPLNALSNIHLSSISAVVSFARVFELLDLTPLIRDRHGAVTLEHGPATISFDRVTFCYPAAPFVSLASLEPEAGLTDSSRETVLHEITFVVEPGQMVALVGPSGSGKTTTAQLIARLYDVQGGSVTINGTDVRNLTLESLHRRIGVVNQDPHLFHDTIRGNLMYAKPDATEIELVDALRTAQILPLVESLPNGLDTVVDERGYRFSAGERQRLAIARLLLKAPDIVILDEGTAHLDLESEDALLRALEVALLGRTSIIIAHRLAAIVRADQILVLNEGRIVERGTHSQLLKHRGLYAELHKLQRDCLEPR